MHCGKTMGHGEFCVEGHECDQCKVQGKLFPLLVTITKFKKAVELRPDSNVWLRLYANGRYEVISGQINHTDEHIIEEGKYENMA